MRLKLILSLLFLMLWTQLCSAELVFLSIPKQLSVSQGQQGIEVPIHISDVTGLNIISAEIKVSYDANVVEVPEENGVTLTDTIAEGASLAYNVKQASISFAFTRNTAFEGGGTLAFVLFDAVTNEAQANSALEITYAKLNEGQGLTIEIGTDDTQTPEIGPCTITFTGMKLKLDFSSNNSEASICVTIIENKPVGTLPGGMNNLLNKYWVIERSGNGGFNVDFTFTLGSGMLGTGDESNPGNLKLFCRDSNTTGSWTQIATATSANVATGEVRFEGIENFSQFTIGSTGDSSLPVTLSSFTATASDGNVILKWRTETEIGNVGFGIYRGEEEYGDYTRIGFIYGAGNSAMPIDYKITDKDVQPEQPYFYYLEDIDIAGNKGKSKIIKVVVPLQLIPKEFRLLQNFPNPFNPDTWLPYELASDAPMVISIYNIKGQLVRELNLGEQKAGYYVTKDKAAYWDGKNYCGEKIASGVYFYKLRAGKFNAIRRMVMLK